MSAEMQQRDLFLMTQMQASWARSTLAADCPASSVTQSVYAEHVQPAYQPHMTQGLVHPPLQSGQDIHLLHEKAVNPDPNYQHLVQQQQQVYNQQQQQEQQQQQKVTAHLDSESTGGQIPVLEIQKRSVYDSYTDKNVTPTRKKRKHRSSISKPLTEKRCSNPQEWKRAKKKTLRDKGEEYVTGKGKVKKAKSVQPVDCSKCRFKCSEKIPEETRQTINKIYWTLASYERQRAFIAQHVEQNDIKQVKSKTGARREVAHSFFFTHNRKEHRVCKAFFTKTLDITSKVVDYTMKRTECGVYVGRDQRGRKSPVNKTKPEDSEFIHWHIESFPTVDIAKGKRKKSRKKYLSEDLNIGKMYNMYKDMCEQTGRKLMGIGVYRKIFHQDFNLAFQKPNKEHCTNCKPTQEVDEMKTKSACE